MELEKIQLVAQIVDSIENMTIKMEKAYADNDSERFERARKSILDFKQKIEDVLK